jgi:hypothetical protein
MLHCMRAFRVKSSNSSSFGPDSVVQLQSVLPHCCLGLVVVILLGLGLL